MHHVLEFLVKLGYHIHQTVGRFPIICPITISSAIVIFLSWPDDFYLFILFSGWTASLQGSEVYRRLLEIYEVMLTYRFLQIVWVMAGYLFDQLVLHYLLNTTGVVVSNTFSSTIIILAMQMINLGSILIIYFDNIG